MNFTDTTLNNGKLPPSLLINTNNLSCSLTSLGTLSYFIAEYSTTHSPSHKEEVKTVIFNLAQDADCPTVRILLEKFGLYKDFQAYKDSTSD